jgi:aspartyl aminopeptidase
MTKPAESTKPNVEPPSLIAQELLDYIGRSPTPFHATRNLLELFIAEGFTSLAEGDEWQCQAGQGYVVTRNDSSIIAFRLGDDIQQGLQMVGAHTDSPCLKLKPKPTIDNLGYSQLGIEVYGGVLLQPWFDRDLSIAGRVSGVNKQGELFSQLIDFESAVATIPNLAIHLNREANSNNTVNAQTHLPLIIGQNVETDFKQLLLEHCDEEADRVLDFELSCYDTQAPAFVGLNQEFICSARLDNLLSSYIGARALLDSAPGKNAFFISTDHEEVGSTSACGAAGPFLRSVLERLTASNTELSRVINRSILISSDNAHGIHPNYVDKHDKNHGPILNQGPVIKINASQRYASNSVSSARFQQLCEQNNVPVQHFVMRADMGCGSTIGPITAGELGIETLDIGVPQWAMHSIRETAGSKDIEYLHTALTAFLG